MRNDIQSGESICGIWCDGSYVHLCMKGADGLRRNDSVKLNPYLWTSSTAVCEYALLRELKKPAGGIPPTPFDTMMSFDSVSDMEKYFKSRDKSLPVERMSSAENQYLTATGWRMFSQTEFSGIRRLQLDIETASPDGGFPSASRKNDRIIAVGLSGCGDVKLLELKDFSDEAERELLTELEREIISRDPDAIEGHNIFKFDLPYIAERCRMVKASMKWGRFGGKVSFRKSRLTIAERIFAYTRCDIAGRTVVDTLLLVQLYDVSAREMPSYTLKESAIHFGISSPQTRTYIRGDRIYEIFQKDRKTFRAYLIDDLRETAGLSERLLPTYVAQVRNFPMTLQECLLRGSGMKVESVFLEKYYAAGAALPQPMVGEFIEGALSESFKTGVFKNVLHYDVASLYPSLMLAVGKCPRNDYLQTFLTELKSLREYRLKYKKLAREALSAAQRNEFDARQKSFKILINSFYGYLGLPTAIFGDAALASEITREGRGLLSSLIERFRALGCEVLEADTDGIYISGGNYFTEPEKLLELVSTVLPQGVDLDFDGKFDAMLCYKAKNYALLENGSVILRGSALRNRATEPFLRRLTETLVKDRLLGRDSDAAVDVEKVRAAIRSGNVPISELSKGEFIGKSPAQYRAEIERTGKGRRASMEAAIQLNPPPETGEKVSYYIVRGDGKKTPDWKRARPTELYDPIEFPYDTDYYLKKIDDWLERFSELSGLPSEQKSRQGELF